MKSIPTTKEIISYVANKHNIDEKLLRKQYYYFIKEIRRLITETDTVAIQISNFGTFYLPLINCQKRIIEAQNKTAIWGEKDYLQKDIDIYTLKKEKILKLLNTAKELGIKKRPYAKTMSNKSTPLNP